MWSAAKITTVQLTRLSRSSAARGAFDRKHLFGSEGLSLHGPDYVRLWDWEMACIAQSVNFCFEHTSLSAKPRDLPAVFHLRNETVE
jgi:hypothetical protein